MESSPEAQRHESAFIDVQMVTEDESESQNPSEEGQTLHNFESGLTFEQ